MLDYEDCGDNPKKFTVNQTGRPFASPQSSPPASGDRSWREERRRSMYRRIDTKMWTDPKIKTLPPNSKLLFCYLITNSHTHLSGIYYLPVYLMAHETGLTEKAVKTCLGDLEPLCQYDHRAEIIWVVNMLQYQGRGPKIIKAVADQLESLHQTPLIKQFQEHYHTLSIPYRYPIEGVSSLVVKDQDQEKEQKQETPPAQKPRGILPLLLDEGVTEQTAKDFIQHRNKIKAPLTETALKGIKREADKAGLSLDRVCELCCARGWRGFKSAWVEEEKKKEPAQNNGPKVGDRREIEDRNGDLLTMEYQEEYGWQEIARVAR